jgi:hypothetical protein
VKEYDIGLFAVHLENQRVAFIKLYAEASLVTELPDPGHRPHEELREEVNAVLAGPPEVIRKSKTLDFRLQGALEQKGLPGIAELDDELVFFLAETRDNGEPPKQLFEARRQLAKKIIVVVH